MKWLMSSFGCFLLASGVAATLYGQSNVIVVLPPPVQPPPTTVVVPAEPQVVTPVMSTARQITYLIAFKDGTVRRADQYWVSGATLYYITPDRLRKEAPLVSVDRALSERLNTEQNVAFVLPWEQSRTEVQAKTRIRPRVAHRTGTASRRSEPGKKCCCVSK
jgi:hypothetical protein